MGKIPNLYECKKTLHHWGIKYEAYSEIPDEYSKIMLHLDGGDRKARHHFKRVLEEDEDIRAMLVFDAINISRDRDMLDLVNERACIRWAEGLPYDLIDAVKCHMGGVSCN